MAFVIQSISLTMGAMVLALHTLSENEATDSTSALSLPIDDAQEWAVFSYCVGDADSGLWDSYVVFKGMYCAACAITLEKVLCAVPGVQDAQVNAASQRGQVRWDAAVTKPSLWFEAVKRAGYEVLPAQDIFARTQRSKDNRAMLWRWLVAGFCMMQVMMYATPEYGLWVSDLDISTEFMQLLRWASWVISLPVLVFSCTPFFKQAALDLRRGRVGMDVPVSLGMALTFAVSSLGTFEPNGAFGKEVYFDSFTMFVFFLLTGRWLELRLRERTVGALQALLNRLPDAVERRKSESDQEDLPSLDTAQWERVAARRLRLGDIVRVQPGEAFVADGTVLQGVSQVDEALLTGESKPVAKGAGQSVVAGSHNLSGVLWVRIEKIGADTQFAKIKALMERAATDRPQSVAIVDRWAGPFLLFILVLAGIALLWYWPHSPAKALMVAASILIVTCPCALSLAAPAALLASAGALAKRGVFVQRLQGLEIMAQARVFAFDKTGTLTQDGLHLHRVTYNPSYCKSEMEALQACARLARSSLHPVARALVKALENAEAAQTRGPTLQPATRPQLDKVEAGLLCGVKQDRGQDVLPQEAISEQMGQGLIWVSAEGQWRLGSKQFVGLTERGTEDAHGLNSKVQTHLSKDGEWIASVYFDEALRVDAASTVQGLQDMGVQKLAILSGDSQAAVDRLVQELGVQPQWAVGGLRPEDKLQRIEQMQERGDKVVMVGDGLNDGPVLARADSSVAFGAAVPLAKAQADFVLMSERLQDLVDIRLQAMRTVGIMRQNILWACLYNFFMVPLAFMGWVNAWQAGLGMALSSLLVVANAMRLGDKVRGAALSN